MDKKIMEESKIEKAKRVKNPSLFSHEALTADTQQIRKDPCLLGSEIKPVDSLFNQSGSSTASPIAAEVYPSLTQISDVA